MGAGSIRAGFAYVELGAIDKSLKAAFARVRKAVSSVGSTLASIAAPAAVAGAAVAGAAAAIAKSFSDAGSELLDMSQRTGLSVEALSSLRFAAQQTGTDIPAVEASVRRMQRTLVDAANGTATASDALANLGLKAQELAGKSPEEQFRLIAERLRGISDPSARAAAAMAVFGKSGTTILPMIADLDSLIARSEELGVVMSGADAQAADALGDAMTDLQVAFAAAKNAIGAALAGPFTSLLQFATKGAVALGQWARDHAGIFEFVGRVVADSVAAMASAIGAAWTWVRTNVGPVVEWLVTAIADAFGFVSFVVQNWGRAFDLAFVGAQLGLVRFGNQVAYVFGEVVPTWLRNIHQWWVDAFAALFHATATIVGNMWTNLTNFFDFVVEKLSGNAADFKWTGLLEGFQLTFRDMKEVADREIGPLERDLQERFDELFTPLSEEYANQYGDFGKKVVGKIKDAFRSVDRPASGGAGQAGEVPAAIKTPTGGTAVVDEIATATKRDRAGGFNVAGVFGLGIGSSLENIEKHTKKAADKLERIERDGGAEFE